MAPRGTIRHTPGFEAEVGTMDTRNMLSMVTMTFDDKVVHGQVQSITQYPGQGKTLVRLTDGEDYLLDSDVIVHLSAPMPNSHLYSILQVLNKEFGTV